MNKGYTVVELLIIVTMLLLVGAFTAILVKYGNTPVSEMPIWVYWLIGK